MPPPGEDALDIAARLRFGQLEHRVDRFGGLGLTGSARREQVTIPIVHVAQLPCAGVPVVAGAETVIVKTIWLSVGRWCRECGRCGEDNRDCDAGQ